MASSAVAVAEAETSDEPQYWRLEESFVAHDVPVSLYVSTRTGLRIGLVMYTGATANERLLPSTGCCRPYN